MLITVLFCHQCAAKSSSIFSSQFSKILPGRTFHATLPIRLCIFTPKHLRRELPPDSITIQRSTRRCTWRRVSWIACFQCCGLARLESESEIAIKLKSGSSAKSMTTIYKWSSCRVVSTTKIAYLLLVGSERCLCDGSIVSGEWRSNWRHWRLPCSTAAEKSKFAYNPSVPL